MPSIRLYVFENCSGLTSIVLPSSVTEIRGGAFKGCSNLKDIYFQGTKAQWDAITLIGDNDILKNVTVHTVEASGTCGENLTWELDDNGTLTISGEGAMDDYGGTWSAYAEKVESVIINSGVKSIGKSAFFSFTNLQSVTIPSSVTIIGDDAFYLCSGLTSITIPSSVTSIGSSAFEGCENLKTAGPTGSGCDYEFGWTESIPDNAFFSSLTSITLPTGITSIKSDMFSGCANLISIDIPSSVTSIGDYSFSSCRSLTSVSISGNVTSIGEGAFGDCSSLTSIEIPNSVTFIDSTAFYGCSSLTNITVSEGNTSYCSKDGVLFNKAGTELVAYPIGHGAEYAIPSGVTSIGEFSFYGCSILTTVTIPGNVTSIGLRAFECCNNLTDVYFQGTEAQWKSVTIGDGNEPLSKINLHTLLASGTCGTNLIWELDENGVLTISGEGAMDDYYFTDNQAPWYSKKSEIKAAVINSGVTSIGNYAFDECNKLISIIIPDSIVSIGEDAFYNCGSLTSITIPTSVMSIGDAAFYNCHSLTSIAVPSGVTSIGYRMFDNCYGLKSITLPSELTNIGSSAFYSCNKLTGIEIPSGVTNIGDSAFGYCSGLTSIVIPSKVTNVGVYAFSECSHLTSVTFSGDAPKIGNNCFKNVTATAYYPAKTSGWTENAMQNYGGSITWMRTGNPFGICGTNLTWELNNEGVLTISGEGAMDDYIYYPEAESPAPWYAFCESISGVVIEDGVTTIGNQAFNGCSKLTDISIPGSVTSIGAEAFRECSSLSGVTVPASVTSISHGAFCDCSGMKSVTLPAGVIWIEYDTFNGCSSLTSITIPDSVRNIEGGAFCGCSSLTEITLPNGVGSIGVAAFYNCSNLTSITIPASVWEIGENAFEGCSSLTDIYFYGTKAQWKIIGGDKIHGNVTFPVSCGENLAWQLDENGVLTVSGEGAMDDYDPEAGKPASWDASSEKIIKVVIKDDVTSIGERAFSGCSNLEEISISGSVTSIGAEAFGDCSSLTSIVFKGNAPAIDDNAFYGVTATAVYPTAASGWTNAVEKNYGGAITWKASSYTVAFDANGGSGAPDAQTKTYGVALTLSSTEPMREGYTFLGWSASSTATAAEYPAGGSYTTDAEITLYAVWEINTYTVSFDANGGSGAPAAQTKTYGEALTLSSTEPMREGYTFLGWSASSTATAAEYPAGGSYTTDAEITLYAVWQLIIDTEPHLAISEEYILLKVGGEKTLSVSTSPKGLADLIVWSVENADEGTSAVISAANDGMVTALRKGTAYAVAKVNVDGVDYSARCRVDVTDEKVSEAVTNVSLADTKAAVELYSTDYARVKVLLEMPELTEKSAGVSQGSLQLKNKDAGAAIDSARFTDAKTADLFDLVVIDDRTLEIVPKEGTLTGAQNKTLKLASSYKSAVLVHLSGDSEEKTAKLAGKEQILTISVKQTLPKLTAAALKLNSADRYERINMTFTGGEVLALEPDEAAAAKAKSAAVPYWMNIDGESVSLAEDAPQKTSGKLYLLAEVSGWAEQVKKVPVVVSFSVVNTPPTVKFKTATLTLLPGSCDSAATEYTVTPAAFADTVKYPVTVSHITEGTVDCAAAPLQYEIADGKITVKPLVNDGKAHTYKVYIQVAGKEYPLTVKTLASTVKPAITLKQSGTIEYNLNRSAVALAVTGKNYHPGCGEAYTVRVEKAKGKEAGTDVTHCFDIDTNGSVITLALNEAEKSDIVSGYTYTAYIKADLGSGCVTPEAAVKLSIKWTAESKLIPAVTLKAGGAIDTLRKATAVTLTPTVKNLYDYDLADAELSFFTGSGKTLQPLGAAPFDVSCADGIFTIQVKEGETLDPTLKYSVRMSLVINGTKYYSGGTAKTPTPITVRMGAAKVAADKTFVNLLLKDRYSTGKIQLSSGDDALNGIDYSRTALDAASEKLFYLQHLGNGEYAIGYKDNRVPETITKATAKTVKLSVYFEGNPTEKANATVSIKVNVK